MKSVEDLDVLKLAHQLALRTYSVTKTFPREETFSVVDAPGSLCTLLISTFREFPKRGSFP
jgi:23S rRNA-intervening sequence protein